MSKETAETCSTIDVKSDVEKTKNKNEDFYKTHVCFF